MVHVRRLSSILLMALIGSGVARGNGAGVMLAPPPYLTKIAPDSVRSLLTEVDVKQVLVDPKGTIWAATASKGVAKLEPGQKDWSFLTAAKDGLPDDALSGIVRYKDKLWISLLRNGVARLDGTKVTKYSSAAGGLPGDEVTTILEHGGLLWVVTDAGLATSSGEGFKQYSSQDPSAPRGLPTALAIGPDGRLWVGSDDAEACAFDGKKWARYDLKGAMVGRILRTLLPLPEYLWFGTFGSLYVLNLSTGRLDDETKEKKSLFPVRVMTALTCTPECVLLGTGGGGLYRMERKAKTWRLYNTANGLPSASVNSVMTNGTTVYVATAGGLATIDMSKPLPAPSPAPPSVPPSTVPVVPGSITFITLPGSTGSTPPVTK